MNSDGALSRRGFLRWVGAGAFGLSWLDYLTLHAEELRKVNLFPDPIPDVEWNQRW